MEGLYARKPRMRFALRSGLQLGRFYIGQTLHSALKQLRGASNGRGRPLWHQVDVLSPNDPLRPVIVVGLLEDGSKWTITFDGVHHVVLAVSVAVDAPIGSSAGRMLQLQEEEGSFPRHHRTPRLLQTWVTSRDRPESLSSRCSTNGLTVLEACTVEQANVSGTGFVSKVLCDGVLLTLSHDTAPSSTVVVPPPFIPTSLQDLLPMDCYIVGIELVPRTTSPLLPLLCNIRTENKKGVTFARPLQTVPFVRMVLGGSDGRVVGICVSQQCPPVAPCDTHDCHTPHYCGERQVLFGDTMQSVLTELGAPESCYYRTFDNSEMFLPLPEGVSLSHQRLGCHRSDMFFNYFCLGVDIVFDAVSLGVKKFVLHASPPEAAEFESYSRCHFRLACSQGRLATSSVAQVVFSPAHKWSQVASHLGTACRLQKVVRHRDLEFLGHPCTTHSWYSALGQCMVEVLANDVISCICVLPDVVDECTLPPVPSEDVILCVQQQADQEYEEEACPSIPSSLPSTGDEFEDARSSFQTPSSSLGFTSSHKMDCPPPSLPNVNVVLREAQRGTGQPVYGNLEGDGDHTEREDEIVVVPCFTDMEESEESDAEEEGGEVVPVDREHSCSEIQSDAAHGSSSPREDVETSLTSDFDVVSSLRSETEVTAEEATSPNSSTARHGDSAEGEQLVVEPKIVLYKPGGSAGKASRMQDIIDSSRSPSSKWGAKGDRTIVAGAVGSPAGEVAKKGFGKRSKFALSEREGKLLQRLCKPTATSLNRQAKAAPTEPQTSDSAQQQYELEKMRPDELMPTSNLVDVIKEEEKTCDATEKDRTVLETDLTSVFQTGGVGCDIDANVEGDDEDEVGFPPLDLLANPLLQPDTRAKQFRSETFDRLFPMEPPKEDPKPVPKPACSAVREAEEDKPLSFPASPELSLGSFQDALLKQFDMIKECGTSGSDLSAVNSGGHRYLSSANCGSHGNQSTANVSSHGDLCTENGSGATTQSEEVAHEQVASAGAGIVSPSENQQEKTTTAPILPLVDSSDETHSSPSSMVDDKVTVTSLGCDITDDVGDISRHSDAQANSPSHEDEVALDALQKGRWMEGPVCVVPGALYQDREEPLMSLVRAAVT